MCRDGFACRVYALSMFSFEHQLLSGTTMSISSIGPIINWPPWKKMFVRGYSNGFHPRTCVVVTQMPISSIMVLDGNGIGQIVKPFLKNERQESLKSFLSTF